MELSADLEALRSHNSEVSHADAYCSTWTGRRNERDGLDVRSFPPDDPRPEESGTVSRRGTGRGGRSPGPRGHLWTELGSVCPEVWAVTGVGVGLYQAILSALRGLQGDVVALSCNVASLRERMARTEGLIEGWPAATVGARTATTWAVPSIAADARRSPHPDLGRPGCAGAQGTPQAGNAVGRAAGDLPPVLGGQSGSMGAADVSARKCPQCRRVLPVSLSVHKLDWLRFTPIRPTGCRECWPTSPRRRMQAVLEAALREDRLTERDP